MRSIIIGAGTYSQVYLAYLLEAGIEVIGFVDDAPSLQGKFVRGYPVLGPVSALESLKSEKNVEAIYCPIGNNAVRVRMFKQAKAWGYKTPNYIHPSAVISPHVEMGEGIYVLLGSHIMPYTKIEDYVMISMNVGVTHHSLLEEGTFLSNGVNFGASITAHKRTYVGMGATIMTGLHELGEDCLIGAGAVVIKDVPAKAIMAGVPAKVIRIKE